MKIEKHGLYYGADRYRAFSSIFIGPGYFPFFRSYQFDFSGDAVFTVEHLRTILPNFLLSGFVQPCTFKLAQSIVGDALRLSVDYQGVLSRATDDLVVKARTFLFFDNVPLEFTYDKTQYCFVYNPGAKDYFLDTIHWSFCLVLVYQQRGILLCGKVWRDSEACIPENEDEANWRKIYRV